MVAAGGPLVEYLGITMHPRHLDLARRVIPGCAPFDTLRLRKLLAEIMKVDDTLAESASAPQVHHSTANAALGPIAPFLSPGCQADWGPAYPTYPARGTNFGPGLWCWPPVKWEAPARGYR